jgi:hypothetical protein
MSTPFLLPSPNSGGFVGGDLADLLIVPQSLSAEADRPEERPIEASPQKGRSILRAVPKFASFEEKIFDSLVSLKVAVSQYAMHLPKEERFRLFARLDELINVEDWHEDDTLPTSSSFVSFLKWIIFSENFSWSSIGVSNDGNLLVAWTTPNVTMTANFFPQDRVSWSAEVDSQSGIAHMVGIGPLQHFAKQALFYLSGEAAA